MCSKENNNRMSWRLVDSFYVHVSTINCQWLYRRLVTYLCPLQQTAIGSQLPVFPDGHPSNFRHALTSVNMPLS